MGYVDKKFSTLFFSSATYPPSGYDVKKDTVVFVNNHLMSFDERYWTEGRTEEYLPERFLKQIRE